MNVFEDHDEWEMKFCFLSIIEIINSFLEKKFVLWCLYSLASHLTMLSCLAQIFERVQTLFTMDSVNNYFASVLTLQK